jgi:hypothetical protein
MAESQARFQKRIAFLASTVLCLDAVAAAWPRARFATALAPLNHMLMRGFFFVHGFVIGVVS